jgi:hypothetical protein
MEDPSQQTEPGGRRFTKGQGAEFVKPHGVVKEVKVINHHEEAGERQGCTAYQQKNTTEWVDSSISQLKANEGKDSR